MGKITIPAAPTTPNKSVNDWLASLRDTIQVSVDKLNSVEDEAIAAATDYVNTRLEADNILASAKDYMRQQIDAFVESKLSWLATESSIYDAKVTLYAPFITAWLKDQWDVIMNSYIQTARDSAYTFAEDFIENMLSFMNQASKIQSVGGVSAVVGGDGSTTVTLTDIKVILPVGDVVITPSLTVNIPASQFNNNGIATLGTMGNIITLCYMLSDSPAHAKGVCFVGTSGMGDVSFQAAGIKMYAGAVSYIWQKGKKPIALYNWSAVPAGDKWFGMANYTELLSTGEAFLMDQDAGKKAAGPKEGYICGYWLHRIGWVGKAFVDGVGMNADGSVTPLILEVDSVGFRIRKFVAGDLCSVLFDVTE